jgi:hypothetical protein
MSVGPGDLLLRIVVLLALLVGGVVATAETHAWWTLALAVAGLLIAAGGIAVTVGAMLGSDVDAQPSAPGRPSATSSPTPCSKTIPMPPAST